MTPTSIYRPVIRAGLLLGALSLSAVAGSAALAPAASAGTYTVSYCTDATGKPVPLVDWQAAFEGGGPAQSYAADCTGTSPMSLRINGDVKRGQSVKWILPLSGGLTGRQTASGTYAEASKTLFSTSAFDLDTYCESFMGAKSACANGVWSSSRALPIAGDLDFKLYCGADTCAGPHEVTIARNEVEFTDSTPPAGTTKGGTLLASGAGKPVAGSANVAVTASDAGAGIRRIDVVVDGKAVAATAEQCAPPYQRMHPCPSTVDTDIAVDTTKIADGTRPMQIVAEDGSGERTTLLDGQLVVGNGKVVGPGSDVNVRGAANGSYAADAAKLSAWWPATGRAKSTKKSVVAQCKKSPSYRRTHKVLCSGRAPIGQLTTGFSAKKQNIVRGTLIANDRKPVTGATVQLLQTVKAAGAAPTVAATAVTDKNGQFKAELPVAAGSALNWPFKAELPVAAGSASVAVRWLARARDTTPAASATLRRTVRIVSSLVVKPKRTVRRGRTLTFEGTLRGKAGTPKGTAVSIQANDGRGWRAVKSTRAAKDGSWVVRYRVKPQLRGSYRFRAVVTPSGAYPYGTAATSSRRISIR